MGPVKLTRLFKNQLIVDVETKEVHSGRRFQSRSVARRRVLSNRVVGLNRSPGGAKLTVLVPRAVVAAVAACSVGLDLEVRTRLASVERREVTGLPALGCVSHAAFTGGGRAKSLVTESAHAVAVHRVDLSDNACVASATAADVRFGIVLITVVAHGDELLHAERFARLEIANLTTVRAVFTDGPVQAVFSTEANLGQRQVDAAEAFVEAVGNALSDVGPDIRLDVFLNVGLCVLPGVHADITASGVRADAKIGGIIWVRWFG